MSQIVPFIRPVMPDGTSLSADIDMIASSNWFTNFGPLERSFRQGISEYLGGEVHVATVANATIGLMAALAAVLPHGDGREAIAVASFTFAAGPQAIVWHGYRPAWIDVDPTTLQPSIDSFSELCSEQPGVRAILLTNTFGIGSTTIEQWEALAESLRLPLVIDSAAGFGSRYPAGELVGHRGSCEIFSFHATKPFAIGEGGAVVTRDEQLAERVREFTNFGFHGKPARAARIGLNGKLQELNAAIGLRQLAVFPQSVEQRRSVLVRYMERFQGLPLWFPPGIEESSVGFASLVAKDAETEKRVISQLQSSGVEARSYYSPPVHSHPYFVQFTPVVKLENTDSFSSRMISLPVFPEMSQEDFDRVCLAVEAAF